MPVDNHVHVVAHGEYEYSEEWLIQYVNKARQKGIQVLGLVEHEQFSDKVYRHIIEAVRRPDLLITPVWRWTLYQDGKRTLKKSLIMLFWIS